MARPRKEIDKDAFEKLCGIQCTLGEIAGFFACSPDTVERWCLREYGFGFAEAYKKYSGTGKISLRRAQFRLAERSASMAIWLGKQYLGQKDDVVQSMDDHNDILESLLKMEQEMYGVQSETEGTDTRSV